MVKVFKALGVVAAWAEKAMADGKVTKVEALRLAINLAGVLGLPVEIQMEEEEGGTVLEEDEDLAEEKEPPRVIKPEE